MKVTCLDFRAAARAWAAAVGINGAYFPAAFAAVVDEYLDLAPHQGQAPDSRVSPLAVSLLLQEATRRANWRAQYGGAAIMGLPFGRPDGSFCDPAVPEHEDNAIVWRTSVRTTLFTEDDGQTWCVSITPDHAARSAALSAALAGAA